MQRSPDLSFVVCVLGSEFRRRSSLGNMLRDGGWDLLYLLSLMMERSLMNHDGL